MFQSINIFGRKQQNRAASMIDQLPVMVEMPAGYEGKTVSSNTVMTELLWQQYGLDLLHPEFSRWLEQNAPDVKYAVAQNGCKNGESAELRVGADGRIKVQISLEIDRRLREVTSQYIMWQMESEKEQEEQTATFVYLEKSAMGQSMDCYQLAYMC
jgi:hypothetical protein